MDFPAHRPRTAPSFATAMPQPVHGSCRVHALLVVLAFLPCNQSKPPKPVDPPRAVCNHSAILRRSLFGSKVGVATPLQCFCYYSISEFDTGVCDSQCPYMSYYKKLESTDCKFRCVAEEMCGNSEDDPHNTNNVADLGNYPTAVDHRGTCRKCRQAGCIRCAPGYYAMDRYNTTDWCLSPADCTVERGTSGFASDGSCCASWYYWCGNGECCSSILWIFYVVVGVMMFLVGLFLLWYLALALRPSINGEVLTAAMAARSRTLLLDARRPFDAHGKPQQYSLCTNLRKLPPIGGVSTMLFFNFQGFAFLWCLFATVLWWAISHSYLGGEKMNQDKGFPSTSIVKICETYSGYEVQKAFIDKGYILFTGILYVVSTVGALLFAVRQHYLHQKATLTSVSMTDFSLILSGFPEEYGSTVDLEEKRAQFVKEACGIQPEGVSILWNFTAEQAQIDHFIEKERNHWEEEHKANAKDSGNLEEEQREVRSCRPNCLRPHTLEPPLIDSLTGHERPRNHAGLLSPILKVVDRLVLKAFGADMYATEAAMNDAERKEEPEDKVVEVLKKLKTSPHMYVVFSSRKDRDKAREALKGKPSYAHADGTKIISVKGKYKSLGPETVLWKNWGISWSVQWLRTIFYVSLVYIMIFLWAVCFYLPYGYFTFKTYNAAGGGPETNMESAISGVVLAGILMVFFLSDTAVRKMGLRYTAHEHTAYLCLYLTAMLWNLFFDAMVMIYTSAEAFKTLGARTIYGQKITTILDSGNFDPVSLLHDVPQVLYSLSDRLYRYSLFPCFLLPPFAEMVCLYALPTHIKKCLIRSRYVALEDAKRLLEPNEFDISRYGDITLYATQLVFSFFLSPGFVFRTLLGLLVGIFILYAWDHYRALRQVRGFSFSGMWPETVGQLFTILPVALTGACAVYHWTSAASGFRENARQNVCKYATLMFFTHVLCHGLFVLYLAKPLGKRIAGVRWGSSGDNEDSCTFAEAAQRFPANWFNTNPIHCLRSRHIKKQERPVILFERGYEHLQERGLQYQAATNGHGLPALPSMPSSAGVELT